MEKKTFLIIIIITVIFAIILQFLLLNIVDFLNFKRELTLIDEILQSKQISLGTLEALYEKKQCHGKFCLEDDPNRINELKQILEAQLNSLSLSEIIPVFFILPKNSYEPKEYEKKVKQGNCYEITSTEKAQIRTFLCRKI
ncbi:MAG: hypothetical protein QXR30_02570 [Candidatus Woesearchaeota archaeon]